MSAQRGAPVIVSNMVMLMTRLCISVICARLLGGSDYGLLACLVLLVEIVAVLFELGCSDATVRQLPQTAESRRVGLGWWAARRHAAVGIAATIAVSLLAPLWPGVSMGSSEWMAVVLYALARGAGAIGSAQLSGHQVWRDLAALWMASSILTALGSLVGAAYFGVSGCLVGHAIGALVPVLGLLKCPVGGSQPEAEDRRAFARVAWSCWLIGGVTSLVWSRGEIFFLSRAVDAHTVGEYAATLALTGIPVLIGGALLPTMIPRLSSLLAAGLSSEAANLHQSAMRLMALVVMPCISGLVAIGPVLVPMIYGADFTVGASACWLALAGLSVCIAPTTAMLQAQGRYRLLIGSAGAGTIVLVVGGLLIVPRWGVDGAVMVRIGAQATVLVAHCVGYAWGRQQSHPWGRLALILLAAAVPGVVAWFVMQVCPFGWGGLLLSIILGVVSYLLLVRLTRIVDSDDRLRLFAACEVMPAPLRALIRFVVGGSSR